MKGVRLIAAALCALLVLAVPAMADDWDFGITEPDDHPTVETPAAPGEPAREPEPTPAPEPPAQETVSDPAASDPEPPAGPERDDNLWGDWKDPGNSGVRTELPSEEQQELEEARRELEQKQQQREEAFREAERENAALPEEEEKQKKPAGSKTADAAPTELVLPQREARTGSPVRYILIGALLAGALCIAIYLFTHPAREDDPADETKS